MNTVQEINYAFENENEICAGDIYIKSIITNYWRHCFHKSIFNYILTESKLDIYKEEVHKIINSMQTEKVSMPYTDI